MWDRVRRPSEKEMSVLPLAFEEFRAVWATIKKPPLTAVFDGTANDVDALDYLHYEGFKFPPCGIDGAAMICGEVLRAAAGLDWFVADNGLWFIASEDRGLAISPVARVQELWLRRTPQFGRFSAFVSQAAIECLDGAEPTSHLRPLVELDEGWEHRIKGYVWS